MTEKKTSQKRKSSIDLSTMVYGKVPPQAKDLEEAVLGAILEFGANVYETVSELLRPEMFYYEPNQCIYRAMVHLYQRSQTIDLLTVVEELRKREELDRVGGPFGVTSLTKSIRSMAGVQDYCRIIIQKFMQREMIRICGETIGDAFSEDADAFDLVDGHAAKIQQFQDNMTFETSTGIDEEAVNAVKRLHERLNASGDLTGVETGYTDLNKATCGWQPTDLIILAARPSTGKTAFAMNLANHSAMAGYTVFLTSLEMSKQQILDRWTAYRSNVPLDRILRPKTLEKDELIKVEKTLAEIAKLKVIIDDTAAMDVMQWQRKCRRLKKRHKKLLVIADYIQLFSATFETKMSREQQISQISRTMKITAKELQIPVIALSQLSRDVEKRTGAKSRPVLSDLRESGAIEQDADLVAFLHAPDGIREPHRELIIAKNRMGALADIKLNAYLSTQKFVAADWQEEKKMPFVAEVRDPSSPTGKLEF